MKRPKPRPNEVVVRELTLEQALEVLARWESLTEAEYEALVFGEELENAEFPPRPARNLLH